MVVSEIFTNAPPANLTADQQTVFSTLEKLHIPFERVEHDWANTMEDCKAVSAMLGVDVCKNLVLCNRQKTNYYLLAMPSDKPFYTRDLSHQISSARLSFASPEAMEELLHVHPGSASVLSLLFDTDHKVQLVLDRETAEEAYFSCHPLKSTGTLKLRTKDVMEVFLPHTGHTPLLVDLPRYGEDTP